MNLNYKINQISWVECGIPEFCYNYHKQCDWLKITARGIKPSSIVLIYFFKVHVLCGCKQTAGYLLTHHKSQWKSQLHDNDLIQ